MTSTCVIIGAGMTGLVAADALASRGLPTMLLEKSRGVGGRMATRRIDAGLFDQGAQFLTAHTHEFSRLLHGWHAQGLLSIWGPSNDTLQDETPHRYIGVPSMTAVPKSLARRHPIQLSRKAVRLDRGPARWIVRCEDGTSAEAEAVILTAPLPQSLQLLDDSGLQVALELSAEIRSIAYNPCIALMIGLAGPSAIPPPGGLSLGPEPVRWIADNHQKGISAVEGTVTLHAGPEFSQAHYEDSDEAISGLLLPAVAPYLGSTPRSVRVHRWRYSEPLSTATDASVVAVDDPPVLLAGDSFGGPHVEGAALSGLAAADLLSSLLHGSTR
jgi:renalase